MVFKVFTLAVVLVLGGCWRINAQGKDQRKLQDEFGAAYCKCVEEHPAAQALQLMSESQEQCLTEFIIQRQDDFASILQKEKKRFDAYATDAKKREALEREIARNAIADLIKECSAYRQSIVTFKNYLFAQFKRKETEKSLTRKDELETIEEMKQMVSKAKDPVTLANVYTMVAVMCEYVDDKKQALKYYEKSVDAYPTTAAKALAALLKTERN
jgi:hypothetical protein